MKHGKKIILGLIVFVLLSCSAAVSFAQAALTVESRETEAGASVKIPLMLSGNTGICGATFRIQYHAALSLSGIETGTALQSMTMTKPGDMSANPFNLVFDGLEEDSTNGSIAVLTFAAPTTPGVYPVEISYAEGDVVDGILNPVSLRMNSGSITVKGNTDAPMISVGGGLAKPGASIRVPLVLSNNTGICGATFRIQYHAALSLSGIETGTALQSMTMTKPGDMSANPFNLVFDGLEEDSTNGSIAVLIFAAPTTPGVYPVRISYTEGDVVDGNLNPVSLRMNSGNITVEGDTDAPVISVGSGFVKPGASIRVPLVLSNNAGICGATLRISYDSALILNDITKGAALGSLAMTKPGNFANNPVNLVFDGMEEDDTNGDIAYLNFTAPQTMGEYRISLSYEQGDIVDGDLQPLLPTVVSGKICVHSAAVGITVGEKKATVAPYALDAKGYLYVAFYTNDGRMISVRKYPYENTDIEVQAEENADYAKILWLQSMLTPLSDAQKLLLK